MNRNTLAFAALALGAALLPTTASALLEMGQIWRGSPLTLTYGPQGGSDPCNQVKVVDLQAKGGYAVALDLQSASGKPVSVAMGVTVKLSNGSVAYNLYASGDLAASGSTRIRTTQKLGDKEDNASSLTYILQLNSCKAQ
jgi:hypothetical protein